MIPPSTARADTHASTVSAPRNDVLDGVRGAAALVVFVAHLMPGHPSADPHWSLPTWMGLLDVGQGAVLVFFVLSGYVIGLTNRETFSPVRARAYLTRRALRLIPINSIAVLLACLAATSVTWQVVVGHLLFLENNLLPASVRTAVIATNPNLWSLQYEALYYLVFVALWALRPPVAVLLVATLVLALGLPPALGWLPALASGFLFWYAGFWLARRSFDKEPTKASNWPALVLIGISTWKLTLLTNLLGRFGLTLTWGQWVHFGCLDFLPVSLCLIAGFVGDRSVPIRILRHAIWIWPGVFIAWRLMRGSFAWDAPNLLYLSLYLAGLACWRWRAPNVWLRTLAPIGAISYAFYAIAYPMMILLGRIAPSFSGSATTFLIRLAAALGVILALSWVLERRLQPWIRARVLRRCDRRSTPALRPTGMR